MVPTHTTTLARVKRSVALLLAVALGMNDIGQATAITYDSTTATYFDVIDDFEQAGYGTYIGLKFGSTLDTYLRFDRSADKFIFNNDLDVQGTISGSRLTIMGSASISGALTIEGGTAALSGSVLRGFGLNADCDTAGTSKLLWDATEGRFSCGTDTDTNTTYTAGQGLSLNGTSFRLNTTITGSLVNFQTVSGSTVYAKNTLASSGMLIVENLSQSVGATIIAQSASSEISQVFFNSTTGNTATDGLYFGSLNAAFLINRENYGLHFGTNNISRMGITADGNVGIGVQIEYNIPTLTVDAKLETVGTISGVTLYATKSFSGAGLSDCDTGATSKLLWDATTGRFSCGTDQSGGGSLTAGQGLSLNGSVLSLSQSISGSLLRFLTISGSTVFGKNSLSTSGTLVVENLVSGNPTEMIIADSASSEASAVFMNLTTGHDKDADGLYLGNYHGPAFLINREASSLHLGTGNAARLGITAGGNVGIGTQSTFYSGTEALADTKLEVVGVMSGVTVYATRSFSGAGLSDCDTAGTSKLLWDTTTGRFSCGTDQSGGSLTAGQGLSLNGSVLSLSQSISGTLLEFQTVSGAKVFSQGLLASSGGLVVKKNDGNHNIAILSNSASSVARLRLFNTTTGETDTDGLELRNGLNFNEAYLINHENEALNFGTNSLNRLTIDRTGNVGIGTTTPKTKLDVVGVMSGVTLYATKSFSGAGLSDCDDANNSKLLWDAVTARFSCGTDQSGGAGGGMSYATASGIFLKRSGGTMTGALTLTGSKLTLTPSLAPATLSGIDLNANVNNVFVTGNYVYTVSDAVTGLELRSIDIANPNAPVIVGGFETGQNTKALFVSTRHAFIGMNGASAGSGMIILDIGNPSSPVLVSRLNFGTAVNSIYVSGKFAYVGLNAAATGICMAKYQIYTGCDFAIVDFTDANRPKIIGGLQIGANVNMVYVQNRFAYLAIDSVSGSDFRIVDIANPLAPIAVGGLDVSNNVKSVYATGKYAFIGLSTDASTEFRVIDVSNKTAPTSIGGVEVGSAVQSIAVTNDWAKIGLASVAGNDLYTIDLRAPTSPVLYGGIDFGAGVNDITIAGKYAYVGLTSVAMNDMRIVDQAGIDAASATIGSLATGNLFVSDNVRFDNNAYIRNALNVGRGGIISKGGLSVQATGTGSAKAGTGRLVNAFDVRNGTGQHLFSVSENGVVQAGIPSFSTGTMMIATNFMSRRYGYCSPLVTGATAFVNVGITGCTLGGTAAAWNTGNRMRIKLSAANTANAQGGQIMAAFTETKAAYRPKLMFDILTGTGTTGLRFQGVITESSLAAVAATIGTAATTVDYVGLAWEDTISGAQWLCCSGDGTNHSCQSMGIAVQTNTEYIGTVDWSVAGKLVCSLQVRDKTYITTKTTNLSTLNTVTMSPNVTIVNKSVGGATARVLHIAKVMLEQN